MLVRSRRPWDLPASSITPESVYLDRRTLLAGLAAGTVLAGCDAAAEEEAAIAPELYPAEHNDAYAVDRAVTPEMFSTRYNNFYEFGSDKGIWQNAQVLKLRKRLAKQQVLVARLLPDGGE